MNQFLLIAADLIAITALVVMLFARHRRRDLVTVNLGVLAVATILGTTEVGLGVGLGLFGVLSIVRLRSTEISQHEVAYYFATLAMGLVAGLAGIAAAVPWFSLAVIALVLVVIGIADQPGLLRGTGSVSSAETTTTQQGPGGGMEADGGQKLTVTGGILTVAAGGDAIDSNGSSTQTGGTVCAYAGTNDGDGRGMSTARPR